MLWDSFSGLESIKIDEDLAGNPEKAAVYEEF
jgi:hypothetical protein